MYIRTSAIFLAARVLASSEIIEQSSNTIEQVVPEKVTSTEQPSTTTEEVVNETVFSAEEPLRVSETGRAGKRLGMYTWSNKLWRDGARSLVDFFASPDGQEWGRGDVTINIGDHSSPHKISNKEQIVPFIQAYRAASGNYESVVWLSYGDTVSKEGWKMEAFTRVFFDWIQRIPADVAVTLGTIGLSYDIEKMPAASTESGLILAQALKAKSPFPAGKLLIQHTIEGKRNPDGTHFVMKHADSALVMIYRNYMTSEYYSQTSNLLNRAKFFLKEQCVRCLDDAYATENYKAKMTLMVEASCRAKDYCAKLSFCAYGRPGEGAFYLWDTLMQLQSALLSSLMTPAQFERLMNPVTTYAVHDWKCMCPYSYFFVIIRVLDFQCFEPMTYGLSTGHCDEYPALAAQCRTTLGLRPDKGI
jgi:hypothetical protein